MESVLVGVDRSEGAKRAVRFALERARVNSWRVTLVYVINWSQYSFRPPGDNEARPRARRDEIQRAQHEVIDSLLDCAEFKGLSDGISIDSLIRHGRPSEVLAELADEGRHDVIVVGRTGESNLRMAIFGSTSNRLVQHASVPVVVVP